MKERKEGLSTPIPPWIYDFSKSNAPPSQSAYDKGTKNLIYDKLCITRLLSNLFFLRDRGHVTRNPDIVLLEPPNHW